LRAAICHRAVILIYNPLPRVRKDYQELFLEHSEILEQLFCSKLSPRGHNTSWRIPCALDISLFLQTNMPSQLAKTTYTLPRPGTTTGVSGTELFGEEWSHQVVSQCLLPQDVAHALEAPLRQPLSASIGRRTTLIPGTKLILSQSKRLTLASMQVYCRRSPKRF
jgi:hypothetical protein